MQAESKEATKDVYTLVTDRIIELLEMGTIPWRKPWGAAGIPQNLISKRPYGGINVLLLNSMDYEQNLYLTWNQLQDIGATVAKGEKGTFVVFQTMVEKEVNKNGETTVENKLLLRYYKVFNVAQCRNIPKTLLPTIEDTIPLVECEAVVKAMPLCPKIRHTNENKAYYVPSSDCITMPKQASFASPSAYYGVLFHELVHATGAEKRLGRRSIYDNPKFGSEMYSVEELIAEIGSCYLKSLTGIAMDDLENSVAYIDNWLEVLHKDKRFIIQAASKAQQATDYILNIHRSKEVEN